MNKFTTYKLKPSDLIISTLIIIVGAFITKYFDPFQFKPDAFEKMKTHLPNYLFISVLIERFVQGIILVKENKEINSIRTEIKNDNKSIEIRRHLINANLEIDNSKLLSTNVTDINNLKINEKKLVEKETDKSHRFNIYALLIGFILSVIGFRFFHQLFVPGDDNTSVWAMNLFDVLFTSILFAGGSKFIEELMDLIKGFKIART